MATLTLPKPVNTYAGEDELRLKPNGIDKNGESTPNGDEGMEDDPGLGGEYRPPKASDKYKQGIIYPPKEIRGRFLPSTPCPSGLTRLRYHRQDRWSHIQIAQSHHAGREDPGTSEDRPKICVP